MRTSMRRRMTLGEGLIGLICSAGFTLVFHLYGLGMAFPIVVGFALYRLLDGILDTRRPLAAAIAVPFAHGVWMAISTAIFLIIYRQMPPYAIGEVVLLTGFPFLLLFFPAVVPALVLVVCQTLGVLVHVHELLNPAVLEARAESLGVPFGPAELREVQLGLFAHIGYRVTSIAAILGCLFAYYWPRAPRRLRPNDDVLDLTTTSGDYLRPWVRDADGNYHRG